MEYLTSRQASIVLGCGTDLVKKYYAMGLLDGHTLPPRGDLRVTRESVEGIKGTRTPVPESTVPTSGGQ